MTIFWKHLGVRLWATGVYLKEFWFDQRMALRWLGKALALVLGWTPRKAGLMNADPTEVIAKCGELARLLGEK